MSRNVAGPPVYYPPGVEMFTTREESSAQSAVSSVSAICLWLLRPPLRAHRGRVLSEPVFQGGGYKGKAKAKYEYKMKQRSKESSKTGKAVVPVCLPLCCAMPCTIM